MSEEGVAGLFLKEKAQLLKQIGLFTDIRKNPQIKLTHIVLSVLMMPFFSLQSFLSLDRVSRRSELIKYFGCTRKMVASDSTVSRALHWLKPQQLGQFRRSVLPLLREQPPIAHQNCGSGRLDRKCLGGLASLFFNEGKTGLYIGIY